MDIEVTGSERRNLIMTSLAFILYFTAGGYMNADTVTISLVNIGFSKPWVLALFAWGMLGWFFFRFWHWSSLKNSKALITNEILKTGGQGNGWRLQGFAEKRTGKKTQVEGGLCRLSISRNQKKWLISYQIIKSIQVEGDPGGPNTTVEPGSESEIGLSGFAGFIIMTKLKLITFKNNDAYIIYFVPYLFFWPAVILGVYSILNDALMC